MKKKGKTLWIPPVVTSQQKKNAPGEIRVHFKVSKLV